MSGVRSGSSWVVYMSDVIVTQLCWLPTAFGVLVVTRRPCSDFMDMLRRLISRRIIIIIITGLCVVIMWRLFIKLNE